MASLLLQSLLKTKEGKKLKDKSPFEIGEQLLGELLQTVVGVGPKLASGVGLFDPSRAVSEAQQAGTALNKALSTPISESLSDTSGQAIAAEMPQAQAQPQAQVQTAQNGQPTPAEQDSELIAQRKAAEGAVNRALKQQAEESVMTQGPGETLRSIKQNEAEFNAQAEQRNLLQRLLGGIFQKQTFDSETGSVQQGGLLANFFDAAAKSQGLPSNLERFTAIQELSGQQPLQKGERERLGLASLGTLAKEDRQRASKFFDRILNPKPLPGESAKQLNLLQSAKRSADALTEIVQSDPELLRQAALPGNPTGQQIKFLTESLANDLLRRESGAAITADERKFMKTLVSARGFKAIFEDPQTTLFKLQAINAKISGGINTLQPDQQMQLFVREAIQLGLSRGEIFKKLRSAGRI